ncbi:hypothetical protein, partial [Pseudoalteromonas luteoviolacea]|uniref:hypothetical protein n=1 Tax=Pseudoalteromonas luteoviolacea TaxID=43657 RepID=UPI000AFAC1CA
DTSTDTSTDSSTDKDNNAGQSSSSEQVELKVLSLLQNTDIEKLDTEISIDVTDPRSLVQELILLVDGEEVQKLTQAPWIFDWENYFWANTPSLTLTVKAMTKDGKSYTLDGAITVNMSEKIAKLLKFNSLGGSALQDTNEAIIQVVAVNGAVSYEIEYTGTDGQSKQVNTTGVLATLPDLAVGNYSVRFRAFNSENRAGPWSDATEISILPPSLPAFSDPVFTKSKDGYQLVFEHTELGDDTVLNISLVNELSESISPSTKENHKIIFDGLKPGNFSWRASITNQYDHQSLWSSEKPLHLPKPLPPSMSSVKAEPLNGTFLVHFEWTSEDNATSYTAWIFNKKNRYFSYDTQSGTSLSKKMPAGEYTIVIQQVDTAGDTSGWSAPYDFSVGKFDIAIDIPEIRDANSPIPSVFQLNKNEFVIFTDNTKQNSNQFIKVNVVGEEVVNKSLELSDNQQLVKLITRYGKDLFAVGHTINAVNGHFSGLMVELDSNGDVISENTSSVLVDGTLNYRFIDVIETYEPVFGLGGIKTVKRVFVLGQFADSNNQFLAEIKDQKISNVVLIEPHEGSPFNAQYLAEEQAGGIAVATHVGSKLVVRLYNNDLQFKNEWISPDVISIDTLEGAVSLSNGIVVTGIDKTNMNVHYFELLNSDLTLITHMSEDYVFNTEFNNTMQIRSGFDIELFVDQGYGYLIGRNYSDLLVREEELQHYENIKVYSTPLYVGSSWNRDALFSVMWEMNSNQLRVQHAAR